MCNDRGWRFIDDNTVVECECGLLNKIRYEGKLRFASIPSAYKDVTLKDLTLHYYTTQESKQTFKAVAELVKWYLDNLDENIESGKGLFFWSTTKGSGKTMLAAATANELINKYGKFVKFATSLDILDAIRSTFDDDSEESESKLIKDLVSADILVIDDFGTERASDWARERFYQIVNKRYINKKVTIYTSNYDLETLQYDDRITNRILERSYVAHFPEESARKFKAVRENNFKNFKERKIDWDAVNKEAFGE